jgi:hypothetical protein
MESIERPGGRCQHHQTRRSLGGRGPGRQGQGSHRVHRVHRAAQDAPSATGPQGFPGITRFS